MIALAWAVFILLILLALTGWRMARALALGAAILVVLGLGVWGLIAWMQAKQEREQAAQAAVCANLAAHPHDRLTDQEILCPGDTGGAANATMEASNAAAGEASASTAGDAPMVAQSQASQDAQPADASNDARAAARDYWAVQNTSP